ncbi:MAG: flagellar biosynthetic protein FliO [Phycisphaerales bacterium]|nr:flagellar biosynthetic protein FliO [Phycisphaerales bacterium]
MIRTVAISIALSAALAVGAIAEPAGPVLGDVAGPAVLTPDVQPSVAGTEVASSESKPLGGVGSRPSLAGRTKSVKPEVSGGAVSDGKSKATGENPLAGVLGPLVVVVGLIAMLAGGVAIVLRKRGGLGSQFGAGGRSPAGILEVLGRYPLSRSQTLVLLKVDRRVLLLSQNRTGRLGGSQLTTLCELSEPEDVASILTKVNEADANSLANRFASVFKSLDREAVDTIERVGAVPDRRSTPEVLSRRAAPVLLPQTRPVASTRTTVELTGAQAAASIRSRLHAIRGGGAA